MKLLRSVNYTFANGETIELFYIGTLASELGRASETVRKWEVGGIIPNTCFKDSIGRRLYSREQINAIVACAIECQVMQGKSLARFGEKCSKAMKALTEKYELMDSVEGEAQNGEDEAD